MADEKHKQYQEQVMQKRLEASAKLEKELSRRLKGKTTATESPSPNEDSSSVAMSDQHEVVMTEESPNEFNEHEPNAMRKSSRKRKPRVDFASKVLSSGITPKAKAASTRKASTKRVQKNHQSEGKRQGSLVDLQEQVADIQEGMGTIRNEWLSMIHEFSQLREALRTNPAHQASTQSLACRVIGIPEQPLAVTSNVSARETGMEHMNPSIIGYDTAQPFSGPSLDGLPFGASPLEDTTFAGWPFAGTPPAASPVYGAISPTTAQDLNRLSHSSTFVDPTLMDTILDPMLMNPMPISPAFNTSVADSVAVQAPAPGTSVTNPVAVQARSDDPRWAGLNAEEQAVQQRRMNMTASQRSQNDLGHYYHINLQGVVIGDLWMTSTERYKFWQKQRRLGAPRLGAGRKT